MFERLKRSLYRMYLRARGVKLQHPIRGYDYLYGNAKGLNNGTHIMFESAVKLNIGDNNALLTIGDFVYINSYTIIDCHYRIDIGKRVQVGPNCYISDFDHNIAVDIRQHHHRGDKIYAAVVIEENAWLGAGVIILKGVTIGKNSVIAAGAVVTKDIPANVLAAGVPARVIKTIEGNFDDETKL